ncbi:MAG: nucleotidyl transferase AbiEii/AbiGii toxin family protein [Dysgonamonadaceae bacterium]|jgi:predicted nucleotidyltransferase component of viral defense system|nr:nucleotidyl transferase AbiEii/AbiGii toxin family protein [Dysgonamonadaceae bacterium]
MSIWQKYSNDEKLVMLQQTAAAKKIIEQAVEKDWWVCAMLNALAKTSWADFLQFKGGTSLSKAWELINRFSEDIDLAVNRSFFDLPDDTPQQRTAIRRKAFHYIEETLIDELDKALQSNGITGYEIKLVTENSSAMVATVEVRYRSILAAVIDYVLPVVKIEFSAMSLNEPYREKEITTFVHSLYPDIDNEIKCLFRTVLPERTFLEKLFLLHEEYRKEKPRTTRMSRHLYDLEKMMDTSFAQSALQDTDLYKTIISHREKFNNIQNIDYQLHYPDKIQICPPDRLLKEWEDDYRQLQQSFIYDDSKMTFAELTGRLQELTGRIRKIV